MKKPAEFHEEFCRLRDRYGDTEYDRNDLVPEVAALLAKHVDMDSMLENEAITVLKDAEKADNKAGEGLFPHDAHVPLGERKLIKRGAMTFDTCLRRKRVIDANKAAQDNAWALETEWIGASMDQLRDRPMNTKVSDLVGELEPGE